MKALSAAAVPRPEPRTDATIYAVAERAGVSIATVSRVLRGTVPVTEPMRARVLAAAEELAYLPKRSARSLAEGRHAADGIVFPHLAGPYYAEVVLGYEERASELGRSVVILSTHGRRAVRDLVLDLASRVDGLVVLGPTVADEVLLELAARGMPVVTLARAPLPGVDSLASENAGAATALAEHLMTHGVTDVAFLGDPSASADITARWTAVRAAFTAAGGRAELVTCEPDERSGRHAAGALLRRAGRPAVLVCANDEIALGAITAAEDVGLAIPEDLAVTGWDDVMAARHARPALTTVRQPMRELGELAAHRLHDRIGGPTSDPRHDVLPTQLVIRASCGHHTEEDR